jgi:arylsulfatase A-like enzyme/Tfp pilus assembly protein PilF
VNGRRPEFPAILATAALLSVHACTAPATDFASLRGDQTLNVVLVTLDTLRADRLGAYGYSEVETPTIDNLAAQGVLFERAYSPTPLTLPAHSSLMTGTYPAFHGVRDNGAFVIPPTMDTLAKIFARNDYATAAFVGAFVLDSRWGLSGGFDTYFDEFVLPKEQVVGLGAVQRPAAEVVDAALDWLGGPLTKPFFLWVHLYDAHTPYTPPEPYRTRYAGRPYLGEIAYTDAQVGRLLGGLDEQTRARTIVVVAADHGEGLDDHGEIEHGFFLYEEAIRVPLIISTPYASLHGIRRNELVSLVDVMPTVLEATGLPLPDQVQGESMLPLLGTEPAVWRDIVYAESYYPRLHFGWSELKTVRSDRYKLIRAPVPELYDLTVDAGEHANVADQINTAYAALSQQLDTLDRAYSEGASQHAAIELDEETRGRLAALGYLSTFADSGDEDSSALPNPRDKIGVYNDLLRAKQLKLRGELEPALRLLESIVIADPGVIDAHVTLGTLYSQLGRHEDAAATYEAALAHKPGDLSLVLLLVGSNSKLGRVERALQVIADFEDLLPDDPRLYFTRGNLLRFTGDTAGAVRDYEHSLDLNPDAAPAWAALAGTLVAQREFNRARVAIDQALAIDADVPDANFVDGQLLQQAGDLVGAEIAYLRELELSPEHLRSAYNLSIIYRELDNEPQEERYLRRSIEINPQFPLSHLYLARLYMRHNQNLDTAIRMAEWALTQQLADRDQAFAFFLLADLYNRVGDVDRAQENLRRGNILRARLLGPGR